MLIKTAPWQGFFAYVIPDAIWARGPLAVNNYLYNVMVGVERKFEFAHQDDQHGIHIFLSAGDKKAWQEERNEMARAYAGVVLNDRKRAAKAAKEELNDEDWL